MSPEFMISDFSKLEVSETLVILSYELMQVKLVILRYELMQVKLVILKE